MNTMPSVVKPSMLAMWWFPLFVAIVVLVGSPVVLLPMIGQIIHVNQNLGQTEENLSKAEKKIGQLHSVDEAQLGQLSVLFKQALPAQKPYYQVLLLLQQLGSETGVNLGDFELNVGTMASDSGQLVTKVTKSGYIQINTKLSVVGNTEQVSNFIARLHQAIPLLVVSNITISNPSADVEGTGLRRVNLDLQLLYMPDPPARKAISYDPLPSLSGDVETVSQELSQYSNPDAEAQSGQPSVTDFSRTDIFNF